jgi:hypothetical protein
MKDLQHKILLILTAITVIAEVGSIVLWMVNPRIPLGQARVTLAVDYRIAVADAAVFAFLNLAAFILIIRRTKRGPIFLIAISIINRIISFPLFIGGAHFIFITWTTLLVIFSYLSYRRMPKQ